MDPPSARFGAETLTRVGNFRLGFLTVHYLVENFRSECCLCLCFFGGKSSCKKQKTKSVSTRHRDLFVTTQYIRNSDSLHRGRCTRLPIEIPGKISRKSSHYIKFTIRIDDSADFSEFVSGDLFALSMNLNRMPSAAILAGAVLLCESHIHTLIYRHFHVLLCKCHHCALM
jgi:hypothetical protein